MRVYTYLIQSGVDGSYYVGISENPGRRLSEHNQGKLSYTSKKKPWYLLYQKEHSDYKEAREHERWLKKKNRMYKSKLVTIMPT